MLEADFWARDSLWPALRPSWKAPTNISWFGWETFMVYSLKRAMYSQRDSEGPRRTLNRLVVDTFLCFLYAKCWTILRLKFWYSVTENLDKLIYQHKAASLNVPTKSLHFRESEALTIAIWFLMEMICSWGSLLPSKDANGGGLKFSGTTCSHTASANGWSSKSSSSVFSSRWLWVCNVWTLSCRVSFCCRKVYTRTNKWVISVGGSSLVGDTSDMFENERKIRLLSGLRKFYLGPTVGAKYSRKTRLDNLPKWTRKGAIVR